MPIELRIPFCPITPTVRQTAFLLTDGVPEVLYGGAAGGGKSAALLMAALQYVKVPGYAALLLRRTYADLSKPGALMDRAAEWLKPQGIRWISDTKTWRFPSGATLSFGYLENVNDHYQYMGSEYQFVGFDELTQFREAPYRYLFSRLRRLEGSPIPIRMRAASNPGGIGGTWVRERFISAKMRDRWFIPAKLQDNPYLDKVEYEKALAELDEVERERLLNGDWFIANKGLVFGRIEDCVVPDQTPVPSGTAYGGIDYGFRNPFAALWGVLDHDDVLWVTHERYLTRTSITDHSKALPRGDITWYADPAGATESAELRAAGHAIGSTSNDIQAGIAQVNWRIRTGRLRIHERCTNLRRESGLYQYDDMKDGEKPIDRDNHACSALRYLVMGIDRGQYVSEDQVPVAARTEEDELRQIAEYEAMIKASWGRN